jgi:hypothetical protein
MVEEAEQIVGMIVDCIRRRWRIRQTMPTLIIKYDPEPLGKRRSDLLPDPQVAPKGVDEDESRSFGWS